MDHYMHTVLEDRATAVAKLPDLDAEPEGTADARRAG
jgi:hypothetical protein